MEMILYHDWHVVITTARAHVDVATYEEGDTEAVRSRLIWAHALIGLDLAWECSYWTHPPGRWPARGETPLSPNPPAGTAAGSRRGRRRCDGGSRM